MTTSHITTAYMAYKPIFGAVARVKTMILGSWTPRFPYATESISSYSRAGCYKDLIR